MNDSKQEAKQQIRKALQNSGILAHIDDAEPELQPNSVTVLKRRYLSKDRFGNILEDTEGMFNRVAHNLSMAENNYPTDNENETELNRQAAEAAFYRVMRSLNFLPNSPTLMNAGRELQQLSACFVLPVEDSLSDIFATIRNTALIHKSGGGTGFSFNRVRPEGDIVGTTGGVASGPVSFIRAFDTATDVIKQGGTRRGANMAILNVDHPDILKFIHSKEDGVTLSNFNISVAVTEDFMQKVQNNETYDLIHPNSKETIETLRARDVFESIVQMAWKTGDPGIVFIDRLNQTKPNPQLGNIESTNPCVTADTIIMTANGPRSGKKPHRSPIRRHDPRRTLRLRAPGFLSHRKERGHPIGRLPTAGDTHRHTDPQPQGEKDRQRPLRMGPGRPDQARRPGGTPQPLPSGIRSIPPSRPTKPSNR